MGRKSWAGSSLSEEGGRGSGHSSLLQPQKVCMGVWEGAGGSPGREGSGRGSVSGALCPVWAPGCANRNLPSPLAERAQAAGCKHN